MADRDDVWRRETASRHYGLYVDYARILRVWLVAYGIGGPVLFVNSPTLTGKLLSSGHAFSIVAIFLLGVLAQIVIAVVSKWASWYLYAGTVTDRFKRSRMYLAASWLSDRFWIDLGFDLLAIVLFGWATVRTLLIVL